jgi:hypothetical protein
MPARKVDETEHDPPRTPRATSEIEAERDTISDAAPESSLREVPEAAKPAKDRARLELAPESEPGDTLLSAGAPASRLELMLEDRFGTLEKRLDDLEARRFTELDRRLQRLERERQNEALDAWAVTRNRPWLWLVFLAVVAAVFQLLRLLG